MIIGFFVESIVYRYQSNRSAVINTMEDQFIVKRGKRWYDFYVKGVNLQNNEPSNAAISKADYKKWFKEIAALNANVIRIYTVLSPNFYKAFFEYNLLTDKPLYLLHGIRSHSAGRNTNAYDDRLNAVFLEEIRQTIDVVHGKASSRQSAQTSGSYNLNIAPFVIGYILGEKMDANFVIATDEKNAHVFGFEGDYLYTVNASPCESWLAAMGNYVISYEHEKYGGPYKLISWVNYPATAPIEDRNDQNQSGTVSVDFEHIRPTEKFNAGIFASYNIYPNYPAGNYGSSNRQYESNPYAEYLRTLKNHHKMPVIDAEFNGNTADGTAVQMLDSIFNTGFNGGILFAWQDEWLDKSNSIVREKFAEY